MRIFYLIHYFLFFTAAKPWLASGVVIGSGEKEKEEEEKEKEEKTLKSPLEF